MYSHQGLKVVFVLIFGGLSLFLNLLDERVAILLQDNLWKTGYLLPMESIL